MKATAGDRLVVKGHRIGEPDRDAEIIEVRGKHGEPPYVVRWWDDGHVALLFPGPDAFVEHFVHDARPRGQRSSAVLEPVSKGRRS